MTSFTAFSHPSANTYGPAALAVVTLLGTVLLARSGRSRAVVPAVARRRLDLPKGVVRWLVIAGLALAAMLGFGVDLQGLWSTVVAALSLVAIGFVAMWSILSHILASVFIVVFRPFEVGDRVEIVGDDPIVGVVAYLNPVYTTLRADDGGTLQIPNNLFFQKVLKRGGPAPSAVARPLAA